MAYRKINGAVFEVNEVTDIQARKDQLQARIDELQARLTDLNTASQ